MFHGFHSAQGMQLISKAAHALRVSDWTPGYLDPEGLRYVTSIAVAGHWFVIAVCLVELVYRPYYGLPRFALYALLLLTLIGLNGYIHYRLRTNRPIAWHWLMALCTLDLVLISAGIAISNGFSHPFFHLFYYPALAAFASMFSSFRLNMVLVTLVAAIYTVISLTAGDGLDMVSRDEKDLLARIAVMYLVVMVVNFATNFERLRWRQAQERERALEQERVALAQALQRERIELSQNIHDTAAQSAYMIGLGIDTARELAGEEIPELAATLEATSRLSRSTIWELRHPINMGSIYEGRELGRALRSHAASFTNVTTVPAEMEQTGVEPPLSTETRSVLFSIAHNALTNAYRHAEATRVCIGLDFSPEKISLSVSDDGVGLPEDYAERGHGYRNMSIAAERLGGHLVVEERGTLGGASVTCVIPSER